MEIYTVAHDSVNADSSHLTPLRRSEPNYDSSWLVEAEALDDRSLDLIDVAGLRWFTCLDPGNSGRY